MSAEKDQDKALNKTAVSKSALKFEYGFSSVNGIIKKQYYLHEIPNIKEKCDVWNVLPIAYVRQFTGLKDKNGKELYFDDIIQFQNTEGNGLIKKVWYCQNKNTLMIGNLDYKTIHESGFFQPSELVFEVIGNIYENPELTKTR